MCVRVTVAHVQGCRRGSPGVLPGGGYFEKNVAGVAEGTDQEGAHEFRPSPNSPVGQGREGGEAAGMCVFAGIR